MTTRTRGAVTYEMFRALYRATGIEEPDHVRKMWREYIAWEEKRERQGRWFTFGYAFGLFFSGVLFGFAVGYAL